MMDLPKDCIGIRERASPCLKTATRVLQTRLLRHDGGQGSFARIQTFARCQAALHRLTNNPPMNNNAFSRAAETPPKPIFPGIKPVCSCEDLAKVSILNTTIDSASLDPSNGWCRVTATVTHPPAGDRVKVWIGLPVTNWNGRFQGNGG